MRKTADGDRADGAGDRDHVGGDAGPGQPRDDRRENRATAGRALLPSTQASAGAGRRTGVAVAPRPRPAARGSRASTCGSTRVRPMTGMKLVSPPQRGTACWCRWSAMPGAGDRALVHPDVEAVRPADRAHHPHRRLGEGAELGDLVGGQVGVVGHVPVRDQHQVPGVVRVQVEDGVDRRPPGHDQAVLVAHRRDDAERAVVRAGGLALAADVGHPVRRPEVLEGRAGPPSSLAVIRRPPLRPPSGSPSAEGRRWTGGDPVGDLLDRVVDRDAVALRAVAVAEGDRAGLGVGGAGDEHERDLLLARRADLLLHPVVGVVDLDPDAPLPSAAAATSVR